MEVLDDLGVRRELAGMLDGFKVEIFHNPDISQLNSVVTHSVPTIHGRRSLSVRVCIRVSETWPDGKPA